jgi:hypothetical protein
LRRITAGRGDRIRDRSIASRASERQGRRGRRQTGAVVTRAGIGVCSAAVRGIAMLGPRARTITARIVRMRRIG